MFLATDANPDALSDTAARAARKPARGGVPNLLCIAEPAEAVAAELAGIADRVTVLLPWGSLLRGVATPDPSLLESLRRLCTPSANVEVVFSYDESRDAGPNGPLGSAGIREAHVRGALAASYDEAGLAVTSVEAIGLAELEQYETTWAKRLAYGRRREVWRVRARASSVRRFAI